MDFTTNSPYRNFVPWIFTRKEVDTQTKTQTSRGEKRNQPRSNLQLKQLGKPLSHLIFTLPYGVVHIRLGPQDFHQRNSRTTRSLSGTIVNLDHILQEKQVWLKLQLLIRDFACRPAWTSSRETHGTPDEYQTTLVKGKLIRNITDPSENLKQTNKLWVVLTLFATSNVSFGREDF